MQLMYVLVTRVSIYAQLQPAIATTNFTQNNQSIYSYSYICSVISTVIQNYVCIAIELCNCLTYSADLMKAIK